MLITLYKIGRVHFRLLATNGFRVKAKKERFTSASYRCRQNLKYENFPSFGRLRQNIAFIELDVTGKKLWSNRSDATENNLALFKFSPV